MIWICSIYFMSNVLHIMNSMSRHLICGWLWQNSCEQFLCNCARTSLLNSFAIIDPMALSLYGLCFVMQVPSTNRYENKNSLILTDIIDIVQMLLCGDDQHLLCVFILNDGLCNSSFQQHTSPKWWNHLALQNFSHDSTRWITIRKTMNLSLLWWLEELIMIDGKQNKIVRAKEKPQ